MWQCITFLMYFYVLINGIVKLLSINGFRGVHDHMFMRYCPYVTELLSSDRFLSFDLIVYYLLANSFIFNLFPWPAAMDSDTVIFFTRACHTLLWIIWSYSWGQCYRSSTRYSSVRHTIISFHSSHLAAILQRPFWICLDPLGTVKWCKWDWDNCVTLITKWRCYRARWECLSKKYDHC